MLKIKAPSKLKNARPIKHMQRFSIWQMVIFVGLFAAVGGYAIYRSLAVSGPIVVATDGLEYNESMALGADGNARISYTNNAGNLMFVHCLNSQCSSKNTSTVDSLGGKSHTSIAVGNDGNARISYVYNNVLKFVVCSNADCTASSITTVSSESVATNLGVSSGSMALGSDGFARIIYTTKFSPYDNGLKFVRCINVDCSAKNISAVVAPGAAGSGAPSNIPSITPTISLDAQDYGSFAYFEEDYSQNPDWVSYIHCSNLDCSAYNAHHVWSDGGPASTTVTQSVSNAAGPWGGGQYNQVADTPYFIVLGSGAVTVHFDLVSREALCDNKLEVFKVDNANGSIDGVMPGDSGWPAAVSSRAPQLVFAAYASHVDANPDQTFQGGDILALRFTGCSTYYYSFGQANPDGKSHMLAYQSTSGQPWQMGWEDGGDFDYNDMVVNITGAQGGTVTGVQGGSPLVAPLEQVSSAIGPDGNPSIAFIWERDPIKDSYVRFLHCQDPDCASSTYSVVDNDDQGSLDTYHNGLGITIGSDNFARLAFVGSYNGQSSLKFIRCTNADCSTKVGPAIPVGINTGHYPAIELGSTNGTSNLPRISYLNMGTGALEFAGCSNIDCSIIGLPVEPPSAPSYLTARVASDNSIDLSWKASTSSIGIAGYKIYENSVAAPDPGETDTQTSPGLYIGTTAGTTYQATNLQPNTGYSFYVVAIDTAGNVSAQSNNASALTTGAIVPCVSSKSNRCLSGVSWPYVSPFGDQNCSSAKSSQCRPMTMQTCTDGTASLTTPTLVSSAMDQGVDYAIDAVQSGCTYDNPNPSDTGTSSTSIISKSNTRVYAMGDGKIVCVGGNPGFYETATYSQTCPGGTTTLGPKEGTWLVYQLTSGPAKGLNIYVAESCTLSGNSISNSLTNKTLGRIWSDGRLVINGKKFPADTVSANSVLCELSNGTIETGWANQDTQTISGIAVKNAIIPAAYSCQWYELKSHVPTTWGHSMNQFIEASGGPSGTRYAKINNTLVFDPSYHPCTNYPMPAKYANPAWYDPNKL